jgi:hypothetical protein
MGIGVKYIDDHLKKGNFQTSVFRGRQGDHRTKGHLRGCKRDVR